jgi:hypothetical protein
MVGFLFYVGLDVMVDGQELRLRGFSNVGYCLGIGQKRSLR